MDLSAKLSPARFPGMSGKMAAIVGYIIEEDFTNPSFNEMAITSDGYVLAQQTGDVGMNEFIGHVDDLDRNWTNLLDAADLTEPERAEATLKFDSRITDHRR